MRKLIVTLLFSLLFCVPALAQNPNCPNGFAATASTGVCKVVGGGGSGGANFSLVDGSPGSLVAPRVLLMPTGATHLVEALNWQQQVDVRAFTATFTFVPNGQNVAFVINNNNAPAGLNGPAFVGGAGCEAAFFQGFPNYTSWPNNVFAMEFDSYSPLTASGAFTYSSAQIYQSGQTPCLPVGTAPDVWPTTKLSTSPVPLNETTGCTPLPACTQNTSTGDVYSATITYTGGNLTLAMYDVTAGGSCPGSTCFTQTWSGVNIPSIVNGNTAWVGLTASPGEAAGYPLYIDSFVYNVTTPPSTPPSSTYTSATSSGAAYVATPVLSPAAGTYSSAQTVTPSSSTSGAYFCYILSATTPTLMPQPNNVGGCTVGTLVSGTISIPSTQTLYLMGGTNGSTGAGRLPSNLVVGTYTIGTPTAATPVFTPVPASYTSPQTVTVTDSTAGSSIFCTQDGTTPTPSSTPYTSPFTVSATKTLKCMATATGFTNSLVGGGLYTISIPPAAAPTFSPPGGTYGSTQNVTVSSTTPGSSVFCSTDNVTFAACATPVAVSTSETLYAYATAAGYPQSSTSSAAYSIGLPLAATPVLSPVPPFNSPSGFTATLSCSTPSNTIYYTVDGSTPTTASNVYSGGLSITTGVTVLKALCVASGFTNSLIGNAAGAAYTVKVSTVIINKGVLNTIVFND